MTPTAYALTHPLTAQRPTRWDIQARYAMRCPNETVELPAETWLMELPPNDDDYPHPPHYRLAWPALSLPKGPRRLSGKPIDRRTSHFP